MKEGYSNIIAYDPIAVEEFQKHYEFDIAYSYQIMQVLEKADILVILTAWEEFRKVPELTEKEIVDCRFML